MKQQVKASARQGITAIDIIFTCTLAFGLVLIYLYGAASLSNNAVKDHRAIIINMVDKSLIAGSLYKGYNKDLRDN